MATKNTKLAGKISILRDVRNNFTGVSFSTHAIAKNFDFDEIMDPEFMNEALPIMMHERKAIPKELFLILFSDSGFSDSFIPKIKESQGKQIIDRMFELVKGDAKLTEEYFTLRRIKFIFDEPYSSYYLSKVIDGSDFDMIKKASNRNQLLDDVMSTANFTTIKRFHASLVKEIPDYSGYPLVILNKNVSRENKIEFIKETYRQKDVHKYTKFIRDNIVDLNDLDDFIEATIIQNKRITEKSANIQDLFQRVFIGMRGEYFNPEEKLNKLKNSEQFFVKYAGHISPSWIGNLSEDSGSWRQQRNAMKFAEFMVGFLSFQDQVKYSEESKNLGNELFSSDKVEDMFNKQIKGKEELERVFLPYILARDEQLLLKIPGVHEYINKYPSDFAGFLAKFSLADSEVNRYYGGRDEDEESSIFKKKIEILKNLSPENLSVVSLFSKEAVKLFGLDAGDAKNNWYADSQKVRSFKVMTERVMGNEMAAIASKSTQIRDLLLRTFEPVFGDSSYVDGELLSLISEAVRDESIFRKLKELTKTGSELDCARAMVDRPIRFFEKVFPEKTEIIENLTKLRNSLSILLSI